MANDKNDKMTKMIHDKNANVKMTKMINDHGSRKLETWQPSFSKSIKEK